jgi:hypothetical protein
MRQRAAAAALVEQDYAVPGGIKKSSVSDRTAGSRAAMDKKNGLAIGVAAFLHVNPVCMVNLQ